MNYSNFLKIAKQHQCDCDQYGGNMDLYADDSEWTKTVDFDHFFTCYTCYAYHKETYEPRYHQIEPIPVFDDIINFLLVVAPNISALHLQLLFDKVQYSITTETNAYDTVKVFVNQMIHAKKVYEFLVNHKYITNE
jgi:hypothetical protein